MSATTTETLLATAAGPTTATTTTTNDTPTPSSAPEITILTRVASIPMISSSIDTINLALSSNTYTSLPYLTAKDLTTSAYKLTEPLQVKLAPLIVRADDYANKGLDVVESRYPYPFKAQPEDVVRAVKEKKESAASFVNKTVEEKIKVPAMNVAQDIDQRFTPIVNYIEGAVSRFNHASPNGSNNEAGPSTPPDAQYQYQRALALSKTLRDNLSVYTSDQIKHIQEQSVLVQKASETAQIITTTATSSLHTAQTRILTLSDTMVTELSKLQDSTKSFAASLQTTLATQKSSFQSQVPAIQQQLHQSYAELSKALSGAVHDLGVIVRDRELPVQDKVGRVGSEVRERVQPILESVRRAIGEVLNRASVKSPVEETEKVEVKEAEKVEVEAESK